MAGQNATLNVTFTSSGAGSVVGDAAAVQGAIDGITGKTVSVGYESHGGAAAAGDARSVGESFKTAHGAAADLGREATKTARATSDIGREARSTRGHMQGLRDDVRAIGSAMESAGAHSALASGAREAQREITGAHRAVGELESGAGRAAVAMRQIAPSTGAGIGGGAIKDAVIDMQKLSDGTYGVAEGMKAIGAAQGSKPFSWAGVSPEAAGVNPRAPRSDDAAGGKRSPVADRLAEARAASSGAAEGLDEFGDSAARAGGKASGALLPSMGRISNMGWTAMAALGAFTGTMGAATERSEAMGKATAGIGMNLEGMQNMITGVEQRTARGFMGSQLGNQDAQLRQSARTMTQELAPAIHSTVGAVGAMETAKMGSWAALGPQIKGFADTVKSNAPGLQSMMTSLGSAALSLGTDTVAGLAQSAPAWQQLANTVGANGPQLTSMVGQVSRGFAEAGEVTAGAAGAAQNMGDTGIRNLDRMLGARRDPNTGKITGLGSFGHYGDYTMSGPKPGSEAAAGEIGRTGSAPSQTRAQAQEFAKSGSYTPSKDADWSKGMTGKQVYEHNFQKATGGYPSTGPMPSGVGAPPPRLGGPGSSAGGATIPSSIASGLGVAGGGALGSLMTGGMVKAAQSGGGDLGGAVSQHITKAVNQAAPAASSGGAALGGAINQGTAQGHQSSQSVVDTVIIKHSKHIIDLASAALGVHSPSLEFDYLGQMTMAGFGQGIERRADQSFGALGNVLDTHQSMASKFSADYQGGEPGVTVSVPKPQAMQYSSQTANRNIDAHNERAQSLAQGRERDQRRAIGGMTHDERRDQLLQNRANNHEQALANLHISGHAKPSGNVNPFAGDQHPGLMKTLSSEGPLGDLRQKFSSHGEDMTKGVVVGINRGTPAAQNQMSKFSKGMQNQHKKDHGIQSPSTVFASDGAFMAAGVGVGFAAGAPAATSVMSAAAAGMASALQGPMDDYGLQAGYTYVQGFADGVARQVKTASLSALGLPSNLNPEAMSNLADTGLLRAGSGASTWKTNSGSSGVVTLAGASPNITINLPGAPVMLNGDQIATIADQQIELAFNQATGTYQTL